MKHGVRFVELVLYPVFGVGGKASRNSLYLLHLQTVPPLQWLRRHRNPVQRPGRGKTKRSPAFASFQETHLPSALKKERCSTRAACRQFQEAADRPLEQGPARLAAGFFQLDARGSGLLHGAPASAVLSCNRAVGLRQTIPSDGFWLAS